MKKLLNFLTIITICFSLSAQIPAGYYDAAAGLSGNALKVALHNIIKNHTSITYTALWTAFQTSDDKPNGKVWDIYSDVPDGVPPYEYTFITDQCGSYSAESDCYNREHSFPSSWFNDASPMNSDLFQIYPTDGWVNNKRGNYPYGDVGTVSWTSQNGSKLGTCSDAGYSGTVFEPIDAYKGDIARTYFYMAVRYYSEDSGWPGSDMVIGAEPTSWSINMLLNWHTNDTVSQKEIDRNNTIYGFQSNRNPFIDHPEWVLSLWGPTANVEQQEELINIDVFPNPVSENLTLTVKDLNKAIDKIEIYSHTALLVKSINKPAYLEIINVSTFSDGIYFLLIYYSEKVIRKKIVVIH